MFTKIAEHTPAQVFKYSLINSFMTTTVPICEIFVLIVGDNARNS